LTTTRIPCAEIPPDDVRSLLDGIYARYGLDFRDYALSSLLRRVRLMLLQERAGGVRELAERWKAEGRFLDSHIVQALAIEGAEAFAELLHRRLREMWGFPDPPEMTMQERFKARYRGVRVSFGYPACPRLEDQEKLFRALDVEGAIGVRLTEGYMMDPEASVSALVFHHPEARYFVIAPGDLEAFERRLAASG
jgi:hypothetical protein